MVGYFLICNLNSFVFKYAKTWLLNQADLIYVNFLFENIFFWSLRRIHIILIVLKVLLDVIWSNPSYDESKWYPSTFSMGKLTIFICHIKVTKIFNWYHCESDFPLCESHFELRIRPFQHWFGRFPRWCDDNTWIYFKVRRYA